MARLHRKYKHEAFDPRIRALTLQFVKMRPWDRPDAETERLFRTWVHGACTVYQIPEPELVRIPVTVPSAEPTWGAYRENTIFLRRWSMISLFHQFRHHMQEHAEEHDRTDDPEDAQAWACSLFYVVAPRRFRRMARAGRIVGVSAEDLEPRGNRAHV